MLLKLQPFLYSLFFLLGLELIVFGSSATFIVAFFLLVLSVYSGVKLGGKWFFSILPSFLALSSMTLLFLVTASLDKQIFIALSTGIFYLAVFGAYRLGLYMDDRTARGMNMAAMASTIFFAYASAYGFYLNFYVPLYYLMGAYWLVTLLVSCQYFLIIKKDNSKTVWAYSFLLAFVMAEVVWVMSFWPFGYLTAGVIALILYYVIWDLIQSYFLNILNKKRVVANMVFFPVIIAMVLLSAKWLPIA